MKQFTILPEERPEWEALLDDAVAENQSPRDVGDAIVDTLRDAVQAGRTWATRVLDDMLSDAAQRVARDAMRSRRVSVTDEDGTTVTVEGSAGVQREGKWVQLPIEGLTWGELKSHVDLTRRQIRTLRTRVKFEEQLAALQGEAPDDALVGDTLAASGATLEDVLREAA